MSVITTKEEIAVSDLDEVLDPNEVEANLVLERAEAWMGEHGWTRGVAEDLNGKVCLVGALMRGARNATLTRTYGIAYDKVYEATGRIDITRWNDCRCRSEAEALGILRKARAQRPRRDQ